MNYYNEIKNKLIDNEIYSKVKDYSKERHKVITYFEIGKLLNEAGGKYGDNIIDEYSKKLVIEVGKKYNRRTLFRMKQFYNVFSNEKVTTMLTQLTWSHYLLLLPLDDYDEIKNKLIDNEIYSKVKDYSKERHKVIAYFEIGRLLNEAGGKYGDNIIDGYSKKLVIEVGKKYNRRTLFRMKQFYNMFNEEKVSQVATQLSWSHYIELLPLKKY